MTDDIHSQLLAWFHEGYSHDDIIAQASHNWPDLPLHDIRYLLNSMFAQSSTKPMTFLQLIHSKRMKEMERLEKRLDAEDCPVAVHTIYRGLLRDAETHAFKILAYERQSQLDLDKESPHRVHIPAQPGSTLASRSLAPVSCIIPMILAWLLFAGYCQASPPPIRPITPAPQSSGQILFTPNAENPCYNPPGTGELSRIHTIEQTPHQSIRCSGAVGHLHPAPLLAHQ